MNAEKIKKIITRYTILKMAILVLLLISFIATLAALYIVKNEIMAIVTYLITIVIMIIGYTFPINKSLSINPSVQDFDGILEYLSQDSENVCKRTYFEGLVMIKNSLDEMVYYQMHLDINEEIKSCIRYLQGKFHAERKKTGIPSELYNRGYVRALCNELQQEVKAVKFNPEKLDKIQCKCEREIKINITAQDVCNIILCMLIIYKIVVTINDKYYDSLDESIIRRLIYNVGADVMAAVLAILAFFRYKRK